jgi:hypothetical protein
MVTIAFIVLVIEYPIVIVGMGTMESSAYRQGIEYIYRVISWATTHTKPNKP